MKSCRGSGRGQWVAAGSLRHSPSFLQRTAERRRMVPVVISMRALPENWRVHRGPARRKEGLQNPAPKLCFGGCADIPASL